MVKDIFTSTPRLTQGKAAGFRSQGGSPTEICDVRRIYAGLKVTLCWLLEAIITHFPHYQKAATRAGSWLLCPSWRGGGGFAREETGVLSFFSIYLFVSVY